MKKIVLGLAAAASLISVAGPASAAPWQSVNQRQANLYQRIDQGIRNGALTRNEAAKLRTRFASIQRLEQQYRRGGLTVRERRDLDQRLADLARSIRTQKHDRQHRG
jgi:TolA-binding protein